MPTYPHNLSGNVYGYPCVFERLELDRLVCFLQYVTKYKIRQNTAWIVRHTLLFAAILPQISCK